MHLRPPSHSGFTLLEILVSLTVLALALTAIWNLHSQTLSMNEMVRFQSLAPFLALQKLTELDMQPDWTDAAHSGDFGPNYPSVVWNVTIEPIESNEWKKLNTDFHRLDLVIQDSRAGLDYHIRTYRFTRPK